MKEMLPRQVRHMSSARAIVDMDPVLSIIMQSDMAKAFPHIAAAMVGMANEKARESQKPKDRGVHGD